MVEVKDLRVKVRGRVVLQDVSLTLEEGRIYALLGENGSGKTTLLRALTSYYHDYKGSIRFCGKELRAMKRKEKERVHAILPQILPLSDASVSSLLSIYPGGLSHLEKAGLISLKERRLNTLSGGEREMVHLALLLSHDALLYALDEVEASLGMRYKRKSEEAMLALKEERRIVLSSFHDINRAFAIADEFIVLSEGRLVFKGGKDAFLKEDTAGRYFGLHPSVLVDESGKERLLFI